MNMNLKTMKSAMVCIVALSFLHNQVIGCPGRRRCGSSNCRVSSWSTWSTCSDVCGTTGVQKRTRSKTQSEKCGGHCPYALSESRSCNRNACQNGGSPISGRCSCTPGWKGTCCESDEIECLRKPCQHICRNVPGSYTCSCYSCYTKVGVNCQLRQCKIGGRCYAYGRVNPSNQCQECNSYYKTSWSNNNGLSCSDNNLCTKNDRCSYGTCMGTPFTCLECERCDGSRCKIKSGFCVIYGKCYRNGDLRPGRPCQQCHTSYPERWTANNNLACSDNNRMTRNDRCTNGECRGEPFTYLSCQEHHNDACRIKTGYCVITYNNVDTCFPDKTEKPENQCQWCSTEVSTTTWTKLHDVPCDDGDNCTRSDTCKNGQCNGISFTCNNDCQSCNGNSCSMHIGYGYVAGKCTCKIAGRDYHHQQLNPGNECQWCDIYDMSKPVFSWSNRPAVACNDSNACTKQDLCRNGFCMGIEYNCQKFYPQSSCIGSSQCTGDGLCRIVMKSNGTICRAATDQCDQSERCDGVLGTCPPSATTPIYINDGQASITHADFATPILFQPSTDKLYLKLNGFSVTCGSATVRWSLIKDEDKCNLDQNNATLPSNTNDHILVGLNLQNAEKYKVAVQTNNIREQSGLPVCTNPVTIDTSTPTGGWVYDGIGSADLQYQSSKSFSSSWGGFQSRYGIGKYKVAMEYKPQSSNYKVEVQGFKNVNLNVSFSKTIAVIPDGSNLTTKVRAYTKAGLYREIASNGVTVDTSQPLSGSVADGSNLLSDLEFANWTNSFTVSWEPFKDPHTPIIKYSVGVRRKNGGLASLGLHAVGLKHNFVVMGLRLASGEKYCAIVEGENAAGLKTRAYSNCLLIDRDDPQHGSVRDGSSNDIDFQSSDSVFHANWNGFDDGVRGSGLAEYKYTLTDKNNINVKSWTSVSLRTNVTLNGLSLINGNTYYITVRAIDRVGNYRDVKSDGVYIDTNHPVYSGKIIVEGETPQVNNKIVVHVRDKEPLKVFWPHFVDEHSGMKKYQWTIVKNHEQPTKWEDVPGTRLATSATFRTLSLVHNTEYRLVIRGINNAGRHTDITSPIIVCGSASTAGVIFEGHYPLLDIN